MIALHACPLLCFQTLCCRSDYTCSERAYEIRAQVTQPPQCNYGEVRADDSSCDSYYLCVGDDRHFEKRTCPDGKIFDRQAQQCISKEAPSKCQVEFIYGQRELGKPCIVCFIVTFN